MAFVMALCMNVYGQRTVTISSSGGIMPLFSKSCKAYILTDVDDSPVVHTAAMLLRRDIASVTESDDSVIVSNKTLPAGKYAVIIGTIGQSAFIDSLVHAGKIDVSDISGKWETHKIMTVSNPYDGIDEALVIAGSDSRGTAYGTLEISRKIGVHPWYWWADVKPEVKTSLYVTAGEIIGKEPSVKYRGIFINDEDWGLHPWAITTIDREAGSIGPHTYERVMELLLRMKANLLWPAMHECLGAKTFWYFPECQKLARDYGIVLGGSHCDVMLRCNNSDWIHWKRYSKQDFNYATNRTTVQNYWAERVGESKDIDAIYTLGMRGVHDSGIAGYSSKTDKVAGLTDILTYQRQLIQDSVAEYKGLTVEQIPQTFIPYKEVLDAYNAGLQVPEDVTLCWVDDNHGYIRQLSTAEEQKRSGGSGIYYHLSYWGSPHDYLWLSSISPSLISYELCKAYDMNTRNMWVINVGDIKPAEEELQFCMDLAWDIDRWRPDSAYEYTEYWATVIFGPELGVEISSIKNEYYRLAANGKPEHIAFNRYSETEQNERIKDYDDLVQRVNVLNTRIPERLKFAFYQLVRYPVVCAADMNKKVFYASQSHTHAAAGYNDATTLSDKAISAFKSIVRMTEWYNTGSLNNETTSNPKWRNFMSYCPRLSGNSHLNTPEVASSADIATETDSIKEDSFYIVKANNYSSASPALKTIRGLGTSANSISVLPVTGTRHQVSDAPRATYTLPVHKGRNVIEMRFLPNHPINADYDLRVAYSIEETAPKTESIKATATSRQWGVNVLRGYASVTTIFNAEDKDDITLRVSFLDPSIVLCDIKVTFVSESSQADITGTDEKAD